MKTALAAIVMATSLTVPAEAEHRHGRVYRDEICTKTIYEEIYRPPRSLGNPSPRGQIFSESYDVKFHVDVNTTTIMKLQGVQPVPDTNDCRGRDSDWCVTRWRRSSSNLRKRCLHLVHSPWYCRGSNGRLPNRRRLKCHIDSLKLNQSTAIPKKKLINLSRKQ